MLFFSPWSCFPFFDWWLAVNWVALFSPVCPLPSKTEERKCCPCTRFSFTYCGVAKPWFLRRRLPICFSGKNSSGRNTRKNARAWSSPTPERCVVVPTPSGTESLSFQVWVFHRNSNNIAKASRIHCCLSLSYFKIFSILKKCLVILFKILSYLKILCILKKKYYNVGILSSKFILWVHWFCALWRNLKFLDMFRLDFFLSIKVICHHYRKLGK